MIVALDNGEIDKNRFTDICDFLNYYCINEIGDYDQLFHIANLFEKYDPEYASIAYDFVPTVSYGTEEQDTIIGNNDKNILIGCSGNDELIGSNNDDTIIGGKDDDILCGKSGDDRYIFNLGDGQDTIDEEGYRNDDKVVFGEGITPDMITVTRDGADMVLLIGDNGDSIRIVNQYEFYYLPIEKFEFADGTVVDWKEYVERALILDKVDDSGVLEDYKSGSGTRDATLIGSDDADKIYGYDGKDILIGGKGNDILYGGTDDDTYIFNLGDGQDTIDEEGHRNDDKIVFGEGITPDMITVTRDGADMVLLIGDNGDSIRIVNQFEFYYLPIEKFEFADGTVVEWKEYADRSLTLDVSDESSVLKDYTKGAGTRDTNLIGSDDADRIYGYDGKDILAGGKGNDILYSSIILLLHGKEFGNRYFVTLMSCAICIE